MADHVNSGGKHLADWPYPVNYGTENEVSSDVLILGGGIAGCHTAISAAKKGANVVVVDKGAVVRSGSGGAGVDHWHGVCTAPCSKVTPEEMVEAGGPHGSIGGGFSVGHSNYITCVESYDTLLDCEKMGVKIRDEDNEFSGAEFRDEDTRLMFAYDYENKHTVRVRGGADIKPAMHKELKRLGVTIYDRVMATNLLTEGGKQGARVIGATGVNVRTGEFYIFKATATVLSTSQPLQLWIFSTELAGTSGNKLDPNNSGDGHAMAWQAGAEFTMMEKSERDEGGFHFPAFGTGSAHATWYACTIVDANGKEVPWVDRDGEPLKTVSERYRPSPGQNFFVYTPARPTYEYSSPSLIKDLPKRIKRGEFALPLYADLPSMPEHERRAIFGLMVGNEGKTRIPIYENYTMAGFDPDKDMLQSHGEGRDGPPQWREIFVGCGGLVFDWDLKTNLEGLYAAGTTLAGGADHAVAAVTGRYVGRKVADYTRTTGEPVVNRAQIEEEKARVYGPVNRKDGIGWKELHAGICRIMQDYCGEYKSEETLKTGLRWLKSIRESEASIALARNPHELTRVLECLSRLTVGEMVLHACLAREASSRLLDFSRFDFPDVDPPEWNKYLTTRLKDGEVKVGELPFNYWLLPPYAPTYKENYDLHCGL